MYRTFRFFPSSQEYKAEEGSALICSIFTRITEQIREQLLHSCTALLFSLLFSCLRERLREHAHFFVKNSVFERAGRLFGFSKKIMLSPCEDSAASPTLLRRITGISSLPAKDLRHFLDLIPHVLRAVSIGRRNHRHTVLLQKTEQFLIHSK